MNTTIYNLALVMHIAGITVMAGATLIEFITFRQFWKTLAIDKAQGAVVWQTISTYQKLMGIGMALILVGGVGMMYYLHEVWGAQLWFQIKFGLVILVIINGLAVRRRLGARLNKQLVDGGQTDQTTQAVRSIRGSFRIVHLIQLALFLAIYVLSIYKFS